MPGDSVAGGWAFPEGVVHPPAIWQRGSGNRFLIRAGPEGTCIGETATGLWQQGSTDRRRACRRSEEVAPSG
jgi:hypothetical protein